MANTVLNLVKGQSGVLTIGTEDMGALMNMSIEIESEELEHVDISDGENQIDLTLPSLRGVLITGSFEEVGDMDKLAIVLGAGTATLEAFEVAVNTTEYYVDLKFALQGGDMLAYRHSKMKIKPSGGIDTGADWLGQPFELKAIKDSGGAYGNMGEFYRDTMS